LSPPTAPNAVPCSELIHTDGERATQRSIAGQPEIVVPKIFLTRPVLITTCRRGNRHTKLFHLTYRWDILFYLSFCPVFFGARARARGRGVAGWRLLHGRDTCSLARSRESRGRVGRSGVTRAVKPNKIGERKKGNVSSSGTPQRREDPEDGQRGSKRVTAAPWKSPRMAWITVCDDYFRVADDMPRTRPRAG
jgi:hypothetical protein